MNLLHMPREGVGLPNDSNRCFINCVLQILLHSRELFGLVKEIYTDINQVIQEYYTENNIQVGEQCDSALFLNFVLDKVNKLYNNGINPFVTIATITKTQCCNKHFTRRRQNENIMYIYVNEQTSSGTNIIELFDSHMTTVVDDYKCDTCKETNVEQTTKKCTKYTIVESRPKNMFISIQNVNNLKIQIEKDFDFYDEPYILKGFVKHIGSTSNWGHYVIYMLDQSGWTVYSDQRVSNVDLETVNRLLNSGTSNYERISMLWYVPKVFAPASYYTTKSVITNPSPFEAGSIIESKSDSDSDSDSDSEIGDIDLDNLDDYLNKKYKSRSEVSPRSHLSYKQYDIRSYRHGSDVSDPNPGFVSSLDEDIFNTIQDNDGYISDTDLSRIQNDYTEREADVCPPDSLLECTDRTELEYKCEPHGCTVQESRESCAEYPEVSRETISEDQLTDDTEIVFS